MMLGQTLLAKKYATAYLNIQGKNFTDQSLEQLEALQAFFTTHKNLTVLLELPTITLQEKKNYLTSVMRTLNTPESLISLIELITAQARVALLPEVFTWIRTLYYERNAIMYCTIATSHPVPNSTLEIIQRFITRQTGYHIIYTHVIDPSLIAGIRVSSDSIVWEYSISKQLRNVNLSLTR